MITILHNPRCRKSREGLKIIENANRQFRIREYLKNPLNKQELQKLSKLLEMKPIEFTRTKEKEFKLAGLTKESSDEEIISAMIQYPKLIQRPIVIDEKKGKTVLGRPVENIKKLLG